MNHPVQHVQTEAESRAELAKRLRRIANLIEKYPWSLLALKLGVKFADRLFEEHSSDTHSTVYGDKDNLAALDEHENWLRWEWHLG